MDAQRREDRGRRPHQHQAGHCFSDRYISFVSVPVYISLSIDVCLYVFLSSCLPVSVSVSVSVSPVYICIIIILNQSESEASIRRNPDSMELWIEYCNVLVQPVLQERVLLHAQECGAQHTKGKQQEKPRLIFS